MKKQFKKLAIILTAMLLMAFVVKKDKGYATVSGKISNPIKDTIYIYWSVITDTTVQPLKYHDQLKKIALKPDGSFTDTIKFEENGKISYQMFWIGDTNEGKSLGSFLFLTNKSELTITADGKNWDASLTYGGKSGKDSEFMHKFLMEAFSVGQTHKNLYELEENAFNAKLSEIRNDFTKRLEDNKNSLSKEAYHSAAEQLNSLCSGTIEAYKQRKNGVADSFAGKPSPKFNNYENAKGGYISLDDLKGKYVYIDLWATWCTPCIAEIPSLKVLEKEYHGKNIEFVSISVDTDKAQAKWKKMVVDKGLEGIQLRADKDFGSDFITAYGVNSIPRFILIDPQGNVVSSNAPRPSSTEKIKKLFDGLPGI
ncbi:TlpA family protein disulfide reductase [Pedobacter sp. MW01-1-1]|uniref:TlpA family protein disulfide reductase n=1 Tax=Pedobacter sp. MW01-1-1 TaxID=3383027 RepID=UPI003FEFDB06